MTDLKQQAAEAALDYIKGDNLTLGIGTGSTVDYFIEALKKLKPQIDSCVASSKRTALKLKEAGFTVIDLNVAEEIAFYIDGADEVTPRREMIKGGGGALTQEKIIAVNAKKFICIVDESKYVQRLGKFPLAVEILPLARSFVGRAIVKIGGDPVYRQQFLTDNGNAILDVHNLEIMQPITLEETLKLIPGVVESGIFAKRLADLVIVAKKTGLEVF